MRPQGCSSIFLSVLFSFAFCTDYYGIRGHGSSALSVFRFTLRLRFFFLSSSILSCFNNTTQVFCMGGAKRASFLMFFLALAFAFLCTSRPPRQKGDDERRLGGGVLETSFTVFIFRIGALFLAGFATRCTRYARACTYIYIYIGSHQLIRRDSSHKYFVLPLRFVA